MYGEKLFSDLYFGILLYFVKLSVNNIKRGFDIDTVCGP